MLRVAGGDPDALQPLFDRWKLPLLNFFYRSLGSRADAEDLVLQTFERVYRAAPRYRAEARFSTWLFSIARRELLHELRRRRRKPVDPVDPADIVDLVDLDAAGGPPHPGAERSSLHSAEAEERLLRALSQLPERERTALLMNAADELTHGQIAETLSVSPGNLHVILHRARQTLRGFFHSLSP